jgi:hypothetical protein
VKINAAETDALLATPEGERRQRYLSLVQERVRQALKTGKRTGYEYETEPADPWAWYASHGFVSSAARPEKPDLWIRKLDLAPKDMKPFRQVLDRRFARAENEATVWVRDFYDAHYFDSWGEWMTVRCAPAGAAADNGFVLQSLLVELDLLKKNDLISKIARPRMRSGVKEAGGRYLDQQFENLRALSAVASPEPAPLPSAIPLPAPSKSPPSKSKKPAKPKVPALRK